MAATGRTAGAAPAASGCDLPAAESGGQRAAAGDRRDHYQRVQPLPGKAVLLLPVAVQGGQGTQRWWFLNGQPVELAAGKNSASLVLREPGRYQLVVMDEAGQLASVSFTRG